MANRRAFVTSLQLGRALLVCLLGACSGPAVVRVGGSDAQAGASTAGAAGPAGAAGEGASGGPGAAGAAGGDGGAGSAGSGAHAGGGAGGSPPADGGADAGGRDGGAEAPAGAGAGGGGAGAAGTAGKGGAGGAGGAGGTTGGAGAAGSSGDCGTPATARTAECPGSETLADNQGQPGPIAVDGTAIYWANPGDGIVYRASPAGQDRQTLAFGQNNPAALALSANEVFWTAADVVDPENRVSGARVGVRRVAKSGGASAIAAISPMRYFTGSSLDLVLGPDRMYWTERVNSGYDSLFSAPLGPGPPQLGVAIDSFYAESPNRGTVAVDGADLVWVRGGGLGGGSGVRRADPDGANALTIFNSSLLIGGVGLLAGTVYVANELMNDSFGSVAWAVKRVPAAGGPPMSTTLPGSHKRGSFGEGGVRLLVVDSDTVVWTWSSDRTTFTISRVALSSGVARNVAVMKGEPGGYAVGGGYVYWTETTAGRVRRAPMN